MSRNAGIFAAVAAATMLLAGDAVLILVLGGVLANQMEAAAANTSWLLGLGHGVALATLLVCGRLADDWGRRRVFLLGLAAYTLGATLPFALQEAVGVAAGRALQGLGAAGVLAAGHALLVAECPPYQRGIVLGGLVSAVAVGVLAAFAVSDLFLHAHGWQSMFALLAIWGALCLSAAVLLLPAEEPPGRRLPFDSQGALLSALALPNLFFAVYLTGYEGRAEVLPFVLAFAGILGVLWFTRVEGETPAPLLDPLLLANGRLLGALIASFFSCAMLAAVATGLAMVLTGARQVAWEALLVLGGVAPAVTVAMSPFAGALADKMGSRGLCVAGLGILTGAVLWLQLTQPMPLWVTAIQLALFGAGLALFQAPNDSAILGSVPPRALGVGSALLAASRITGVAMGASIARVLFLARFEAEAGYPWGELSPTSGTDFEATHVALRLVLQAAATLGAPAVLASLMKSRGATHEPPTLF